MANGDPVISLNAVRFGYERGHPAVDRVSAPLWPGRVTALVGPNAAGKSTLLRLMLGLHRPWSGTIAVGGVPVHHLPPRDRARWLSYVPQRPGVRFAFTVRQVVAMGAHASESASTDRVDRALNEAGLTGLAERVFTQLSGGQQQQVLLARAQVQAEGTGRAMLLDEPGSHLDLHHRHDTMQRLRRLADSGLAVMVVLHDLDLAVRYADDAWLIDKGRLIDAGPWQRVLTPELLGPVYGLDLEFIDLGGERPLLTVSAARHATMP